MLVAVKKSFGLLASAAVLFILFLPGYTRLQDLKSRNRDLEDKIRRLQIENSLLKQEMARIENDPVYQEKIAREKMGVVRKGEIPLKIIPQKE